MVPKVYSMFDPPPIIAEENSGELITEQAGYLPPQVQIEDMIMAGERLVEARKERFDFDSAKDVDDDFIDPTRSPNFDLSDASNLEASVSARLNKQRQDAIEKAKENVAPKEEPNGTT